MIVAHTNSAVQDLDIDAGDQGLLAAARHGDAAAFGEIYDQYAPKLFRYCDRVLGCPHDAADATQDTFTRILSRAADVELHNRALGPYLFAVARNVCFDLLHWRKRAQPVSEVAEDAVGLVGGRETSRVEGDPEAQALLADTRQNVRTAHDRLSPRYREVLVLREVEGLTYDDIGAVTGLNRNAVAQLLFRARLRLGDELREDAVAGFVPASAECFRARAILARRGEASACEDVDGGWVRAHLVGCSSCRMSVSALAEAGASYRMIAPVSAVAYLLSERDAFAAARRANAASPSASSARTSARRVLTLTGGAIACLVLFLTGAAESPRTRPPAPELAGASVDPVRVPRTAPRVSRSSPPGRIARRLLGGARQLPLAQVVPARARLRLGARFGSSGRRSRLTAASRPTRATWVKRHGDPNDLPARGGLPTGPVQVTGKVTTAPTNPTSPVTESIPPTEPAAPSPGSVVLSPAPAAAEVPAVAPQDEPGGEPASTPEPAPRPPASAPAGDTRPGVSPVRPAPSPRP